MVVFLSQQLGTDVAIVPDGDVLPIQPPSIVPWQHQANYKTILMDMNGLHAVYKKRLQLLWKKSTKLVKCSTDKCDSVICLRNCDKESTRDDDDDDVPF